MKTFEVGDRCVSYSLGHIVVLRAEETQFGVLWAQLDTWKATSGNSLVVEAKEAAVRLSLPYDLYAMPGSEVPTQESILTAALSHL